LDERTRRSRDRLALVAATASSTKPKTTAQIARAYFEAIGAKDLDAATSLWKPGSKDRLHGIAELTAPAGIEQYFSELFGAFPDFRFEILEIAASGKRAACRWRITGTFAGPGRFQGLKATGARVDLEGCDMVRVEDGLIVENNAYTNGAQLAEQLGVLPAQDSPAGRAMTGAFNARTAAAAALRKVRERA
jgi:predicted ester cyclase